MISKNLSQKGSAHVVIIVILVVALLGTLGFVFWQNFVYKEPIVKVAEEDVNNNVKEESAETVKAPLTKVALATALPKLPEQCDLGISDGSKEFDVNKLTNVTSSSERLGPLEYKQPGRVSEDKTWVYAAGGCGSHAGAFVFKDDVGTWKLVSYHLGSAWFDCEKVDGAGIPKEVVGLCFDHKTNKERAIQ